MARKKKTESYDSFVGTSLKEFQEKFSDNDNIEYIEQGMFVTQEVKVGRIRVWYNRKTDVIYGITYG